MNLVDEYQRRLQELPQVDKALEKQIRELQYAVDDQETQKQLNEVAIEGLKSQLAKIANKVDEKDNEIQGLNQNEEKTAAKEKKYMSQIDSLNKRIEQTKQETQTRTKEIQNFKKQIRTFQGQVSMMNAQKSKVLQSLMKKQVKYNNLVQTVTSLKLKKLEPITLKGDAPKVEDNQKVEKQIVDLFGSLKKQMELVEVLKRQKTHLIASTVFKYCEADFSKLLEMNNKV